MAQDSFPVKHVLTCIIRQEVLCKTVLRDMNHVTSRVVKIVNFILARGLSLRQFTSLLQDSDAEHTDM